MARPARIEYTGAIYHVISRGNYRKDLFTVGKSGEAFEKSLFEACVKCGWRLHAYVIMSNHYHLCLETPEGNLVEGMRWLQGTFGNRFNRFVGGHGHVFQGRYKALLLEQGDWMVSLVNYIHLNPVRAGIVGIEELRKYRLSSFHQFHKNKLPKYLERKTFLAQAGFSSGVAGMKNYHHYLNFCEEADTGKKDELQKKFSKGWAIAGKEKRKALAKELVRMNQTREWGGKELREINEEKWEFKVVELLANEGKSEESIIEDRKLVSWKKRIAQKMRKETSATNPWIARRLQMGDPSHVSRCANQKTTYKD